MSPAPKTTTVITEDELEQDQSDVDVPLALPAVSSAIQPANVSLVSSAAIRDKINNLQQKEAALAQAGVTRYKYILVIADALDAVYPEDGQPDIKRRQWAVEQAAKLFGDYVQQVQADIRVSHSVEELLNVFEKAQRKRLDG